MTIGAVVVKYCASSSAIFLVQRSLPVRLSRRDQVVVRCGHVEPLLPHAHAPVAGVGAAQRLPDVVPEQAPVSRIDRPSVVERRDIELAVDGDRRTDDAGRTPRGLVEGAGAEAADRPGHLGTGVAEAAEAPGWRRGHTGRDAGDPPQPELADVAAIDLRQRAVAPSRCSRPSTSATRRRGRGRRSSAHPFALTHRCRRPRGGEQRQGTGPARSCKGVDRHFSVTR